MVSTTQVDELFNVSVYPNPTRDKVVVQLLPNQLPEVEMIRLLNMQGQMVWKAIQPELSSSINIDLSELPAGIYTLIVYHESGMVTKEIVKK